MEHSTILREIKFRAWDKVSKSMRYGAEHSLTMCLMNPDTFKLMQYTGLKDKNGKEIYEGDIVRFDNTVIGGKVYTGEIVWNADQTLSNLEWGLWIKNGGYLPTDFLGDIEVIGNIYEEDNG